MVDGYGNIIDRGLLYISAMTYLCVNDKYLHLSSPAGLCGPFSVQLCELRGLRRLCICRCGLTGKIPSEIGAGAM